MEEEVEAEEAEVEEEKNETVHRHRAGHKL